jgi:hypothetical protein
VNKNKSLRRKKPLYCVCLLKNLIPAPTRHLLDPHTQIHIQNWAGFRRFLGISAEENFPKRTWCVSFGAQTAE